LSSERPEHPFLRTLHRALVEDVRAEVEVALRVAEFRSRGLTRAEVAERLDVSEDEIRSACGLLHRAANERARAPF
jgi:hypothetical protein